MLLTVLKLILPSLVGSGGGILSRILDFKEKKTDRDFELKVLEEKNKHELAQRKIDIELMDKEYQFKEKIADIESQKEMSISADNLQKQSYEVFVPEKDSKVSRLSASIRPVLTYLAKIETMIIVWGVMSISYRAGLFDVDFAKKILEEVIYFTLSMGEMIIAWWFGQRGGFRKK